MPARLTSIHQPSPARGFISPSFRKFAPSLVVASSHRQPFELVGVQEAIFRIWHGGGPGEDSTPPRDSLFASSSLAFADHASLSAICILRVVLDHRREGNPSLFFSPPPPPRRASFFPPAVVPPLLRHL